jgi:osmotically-inducible protein OsmY
MNENADFTPLDSIKDAAMIDMPPLADRVLVALEESPYISRRKLRFETHRGRVTLRGVVGTYFQKQMAQECVRKIDGVNHIDNELEVCWR